MTPIYGYEEENDRYMAIESRVEEKLGRLPETYALAAYDALWIATFVDLDSVPESDESIRLAMNTLTDTYFGVTGWTKLDENGDRENWDYDIWTISETDSGHQWERAARYQVDPGEEGKLIFVE
jgi:branched-chain amino acid transport system substrate-binding protein